MIKMNQFEYSIKTLVNKVPEFVNKSLQAFIVIENEVNDLIQNVKDTSPHTIRKILKNLLNDYDTNILYYVKKMYNEEQYYSVLNYIDNSLVHDPTIYFNDNADVDIQEKDSLSNVDIVAPVTSVYGTISSLSRLTNKNYINTDDVNKYIPGIMFETNDFKPSKRSSNVNKAEDTKRTSFADEQGRHTVFDYLISTCKIDICTLFSIFMRLAIIDSDLANICTNDGILLEISKWDIIHSTLNNVDFQKKIIDIVSKNTLRSSVSTYLVYAGKLIGTKSDIYNWLYTTIVKDTVEDIERGVYPTSADTSLYSGKSLDSEDMQKDNIFNKNIQNNDKFDKNTYGTNPISFNKRLLYKNIRLLYSNWSIVINSIISMSNSRNTFSFKTASDEDFNNLDVSSVATRNENSKSALCDLAYNILSQFITTKYRTYNIAIQPNDDGKFSENNTLSSITIKRIYNQEVKNLLKNSLKIESMDTDNFEDYKKYFLSNTKESIVLVKMSIPSKNILADLFMMCSYLIIMDFAHNNMYKISNQKDPLTDKSNKELFEEIYFGINNNIKRIIEMFKHETYNLLDSLVFSNSDQYEKIYKNINANFSSLLPFNRNTTFDYFLEEDKYNTNDNYSNYDISKTSKISLKNIKEISSDFNSNYLVNIFTISPMSELVKIYNKYNGLDYKIQENGGYSKYNEIYTRSSSIFPKNKIVVDQLNNVRLAVPSLKSLESIEAEIDNLSISSESEWANINHSDLASLGSNITELDNQEINKNANVIDDDNVIDIDDKATIILSSESYKEYEENEIVSICNNSVISKYNKLFNKLVFGKDT